MLLHFDADAFFASVEQAADPRLRGRPVAVGGERRGIVISASYEARRLGIVAPMPTVRARKLCPNLVVLPGDFEKYERFSRLLFSYAHDFTPRVEVASIDEGYLDIGGLGQSGPRSAPSLAPALVAERLREAVWQSLKLPISEGIGSNKLVAQIASKLHKPRGFCTVPPGAERAFLAPLPCRWLPGIGLQGESQLRSAGLATIGQIAALPVDLLALLVGNRAPDLHRFALGIDNRPVIPDPPAARSYSEQETFDTDQTDRAFLLATLRSLADRLMARARADRVSIRGLTLRVRTNDMQDSVRSDTLPEPTDLETDLYPLLGDLLRRAWERRVSIRMLHLKIDRVYPGRFGAELPLEGLGLKRLNQRRIADVLDRFRAEHRPGALMRAHDLRLRRKPASPFAFRPSNLLQTSHPAAARVRENSPGAPECLVRASRRCNAPLALLNLRSCFSFLDSALSIPTLVEQAAACGARAVALADPNLHGAVPFFRAARAAGLHAVVGAEIRVAQPATRNRQSASPGLPPPPERRLCYVQNRTGYENLCRILSASGGSGVVSEEFLADHRDGLTVAHPADPALALPEIRYGTPADRRFYDLLQALRTRTLFGHPHPDKRPSDGLHFPKPGEWESRFGTDRLRNTLALAESCTFQFEFGTLRLPRYSPPDGSTPAAFLRRLAHEGLRQRYGTASKTHRAQLDEELGIVEAVGYEEYFLTVWDLLQECARRGIAWITRGSAADSLVCYCLGISGVCPIRFDLYFRRFLNRDRMRLNKLPDIDIDFAHDRKDDVVAIALEKHGPDHAALLGGFSTFQARSAAGDIAKALGMSERQIREVTTRMPRARAADARAAALAGHRSRDAVWEEDPCGTALDLAARLDGFPRHPKMHPCGVVLSRDPIVSICPTFPSAKGWPATQFDMHDAEAVGLVKIDLLAQGGLAVIRDTHAALAAPTNVPGPHQPGPADPTEPATDGFDDPAVWDMIASGESRGVHHIESPAMITLAKMCGVRDIDRLIAIVSVIRPGAANNLKKIRFARRAQGLEPVEYPHPSLEPVLRSTFGIVAYEEHILQICETFAGMDPGAADVLRRTLGKLPPVPTAPPGEGADPDPAVAPLAREFAESARRLGHTDDEIAQVWRLVDGFRGYAFCRAHSTAYAVEAYEGARLKRYHPAEFLAAVLSHGKGFYSPLAYTLECRRLGIGFRPPDPNASRRDFHVERDAAGRPWIRVPLRAVKHLTQSTHDRWLAERTRGPFESLRDFWHRVGPTPAEAESLVRAGAFDGLVPNRSVQIWTLRQLAQWPADRDGQYPLFPNTRPLSLPSIPLTDPSPLERLRGEMEQLGFPVSGHVCDLLPNVAWESYCPIAQAGNFRGRTVTICGWIVQERLHRQTDGAEMQFLTLCDRSGMVECELFANAFRRWGLATARYPAIEVTATVAPLETGAGHTLRIEKVRKPRTVQSTAGSPSE